MLKVVSDFNLIMDQAIKGKLDAMYAPCTCGSGKPAKDCCMTGEWMKMMNSPCFCGSGKMMKDCCMKEPKSAAHA